jgi:hypothetical protein
MSKCKPTWELPMSEDSKLSAVEHKINLIEAKIKDVLEHKIDSIAEECGDLYDQITELRTSIQEIYSELAQSNRFQSEQLMKMSERLEGMALKVMSLHSNREEASSIDITMNPTISSEANNNNIEKSSKEKENTSLDVSNLSIKQMMVVFSGVILGVVILLGGVAFTLFKMWDLIKGVLF